MADVYEIVAENIINNLQNVNVALENSKIESKVLTPAFSNKLENLKNMVSDENNQNNNNSSEFSPSFNNSENGKEYTREEINEAFTRLRTLPKTFVQPKEKPSVNKKPITKSMSNLTIKSQSKNASKPPSRSNSLVDIHNQTPLTPQKTPKVTELLEKINENKKILEGIKTCSLQYPDTTKFGRERFKLADEFKKALAEITEMVHYLEQNVKAIDKADVDVLLDQELNEMLEQFTKTIKDYNFLQKNSTIEIDQNLKEFELEFPYSSLLEDLKKFLENYC
uniref:CSON002421 protein n=1 Tax=Culicoides sonorensis TaxID=179676 RepID=A0A336MWS6_CULSO